MLKPFADYRLSERLVLILQKTAILALYGYRRYHEKIKHLATKCWPGASFAKFTLYVNSDGGDEEDRTLYLLNAMGASPQVCRLPTSPTKGLSIPFFGIFAFYVFLEIFKFSLEF